MPDNLDGNDAQARKIALQLFSVWTEEQERKATERRRFFGGNIAGWVSVTVVVVGTIIAGASTYNIALEANNRSLRNETAIATIKADTSDRLARIETKIDLMIEERK